jgi:hypothetical protein
MFGFCCNFSELEAAVSDRKQESGSHFLLNLTVAQKAKRQGEEILVRD